MSLYVNVTISLGPEGPGDVLHHIVDVLELLGCVVWDLHLELLLHDHCQLHIVQFVEPCIPHCLPNSQNCVLRVAFSTSFTPSKWASTLKSRRATSFGLM